MRFTGTITEQDYSRAASLALSASGQLPPIGCFGVASLACFALAILNIWNPGGQPMAWLVFAFPLGAIALWTYRGQKKAFREDTTLHGQISGSISEEGLEYQTSHSDSKWPWSAVVTYAAADDLMLVFITKAKYVVLPRTFFETEADWTAAVQLVKGKLPARSRGHRPLWVRIFLWTLLLTVIFLAWHFATISPRPR